jgi:hypothetical protein
MSYWSSSSANFNLKSVLFVVLQKYLQLIAQQLVACAGDPDLVLLPDMLNDQDPIVDSKLDLIQVCLLQRVLCQSIDTA